MELGLGLYRHMLTRENFGFARQADTDLALAHFYVECFQIHFGRTVRDFSGAHVETRAVPRALHTESVKTAFRQWAKAMRAKLLKSIKAIVDFSDRHELSVDLHT